jgi:hypothetical protein
MDCMATQESSHAGNVLPEMESTLVQRTTDSPAMGVNDVALGGTAVEQVHCIECGRRLRRGVIDTCYWCEYAYAEHQCVECGVEIYNPESMDNMCADCFWDTEKEHRGKPRQRCEECECVTENEVILSHNYCYDCEFALWKEGKLPYVLNETCEQMMKQRLCGCEGEWGGCECYSAPQNQCLSCGESAPNWKDMCETCETKHQTNCYACVLKTPNPYISHICRKIKK